MLLLSAPAGDLLTWNNVKADLIKSQTDAINGDKNLLETEEKSQRDLASSTDPKVRAAARDGFDDYRKWLSEDYHQLSAHEWELRRLQAETGLQRVVEVDRWPLLSGVLMLCSGLGLLVGVKPHGVLRRRADGA